MGTISYLKDRLRRRPHPPRPAITVSAHGFVVEGAVVPWQAVSEIWGYKEDLVTTDEALLEFIAGAQCVRVSEEQPGFEELAAAMVAVFPDTARWREVLLMPPFARKLTLLYRRG